MRMGLHTGEPQRSFDGYSGPDVHRAVHIMNAGSEGQVLLSRTTFDLVEHDLPEGVSLLDLGKHHLKDLLSPIQLFQLVIDGLTSDFPLLKTLDGYHTNLPIQHTPFIGGEKEIESARALFLDETG
jgi:class 3 adenylate cyclase